VRRDSFRLKQDKLPCQLKHNVVEIEGAAIFCHRGNGQRDAGRALGQIERFAFQGGPAAIPNGHPQDENWADLLPILVVAVSEEAWFLAKIVF
jgi:hypothetical protein